MVQSTTMRSVKIGFTATVMAAASMAIFSGSAQATGSPHGHHQQAAHHGQAQSHPGHAQSKGMHESQEARDLRMGLHTLLKDHVATNLTVNRLIASGAHENDIQMAEAAQVANAKALSGAIAGIYGTAAGDQFAEMFLEHIEESNNYARAVAAGDESAKMMANTELQEYLAELSTFFSTAIPVLSYDAVYGLLLEHENLINQSTEASVSHNYGQSKQIEMQAKRQVAVIADALATGIIQTQPDKF